MKRFDWDISKNEKLIKERQISFEEAVVYIQQGKLLDIKDNPRYPNQKIFVVDIQDYIYLVPFVETEEAYVLKTVFASRKATRDYLAKGDS